MSLFDDKYTEGLIRITKLFFDRKFEKQDLSFQEELWEDLIDFKNNTVSTINNILFEISNFRKPLDIEKDCFTKTYDIVNTIKRILEDIVESNGSKDGLEYFIEENKDSITKGDLESQYKDFGMIVEWINSEVPMGIRRVNVMLKGYKEFIPDKEEYKDLIKQYEDIYNLLSNGDEFIFGSVTSEMNKKFDIFKNSFISYM